MGDAITLADNNEVANFDIDGHGATARAIASPAGGAGNPNLNNLSISNTTGDGIAFTPVTISAPNDATRQIVRGNVTIDEVEFDNIGGDDIDINSATATISRCRRHAPGSDSDLRRHEHKRQWRRRTSEEYS